MVWARMLVLCAKRDQFLTTMMFLFPTNSLLSSQNVYLGSCPNYTAACSSFILWGIWLSIKTGVKSLFLYFGHFHSCYIICWLEDKNCTNVVLGPVDRWLWHCLENKFWTLKGTSEVLWLTHVSLRWSIMHSTNKGRPYSL